MSEKLCDPEKLGLSIRLQALPSQCKAIVCRLYLVNNRLYTIYVVTPPGTVLVEVEQFLQSFRLLMP